jgi:hypothetical protein
MNVNYFHFANYAPDINPRLDEDEQFARALQESVNDDLLLIRIFQLNMFTQMLIGFTRCFRK